jgi:hypothetical protein
LDLQEFRREITEKSLKDHHGDTEARRRTEGTAVDLSTARCAGRPLSVVDKEPSLGIEL